MRRSWQAIKVLRATAALTISAGVLALAGGSVSAAVPTDTGLTIARSGVVAVDPLGAYEPAATRAANGTLLVAYPTTSDSLSGGVLKLTRSTDEGLNWSTPVTLYTPHVFTGGSVVISDGMTTLSDGTILLPFNEGVNHTKFTNRQSVIYIARSTNNGASWTGLTTPISIPGAWREQWTYGKILQLASGDLLMPVWGTPTLTPDWATNPGPLTVAVLRSHDNGATWGEYSIVGVDPNAPQLWTSQPHARGPNETSIVPLRDGRLMAVMRYERPPLPADGTPAYVSYSADGGHTWSAPQRSPVDAQSPGTIMSPCASTLPAGQSKVVLGYRATSGTYAGRPVVSVSYDNGTTWQGQLPLQDPGGLGTGQFVGSYPSFTPLPGNRLFVAFMEQPTGQNYRVAFNILNDASAADCQAASASVSSANSSTLTVYLQRHDRNAWPFTYGIDRGVYAPTTLVSNIIETAARAVTCADSQLQMTRNGIALNPSLSLAANGVQTGDVLTIRSLAPPPTDRTAGLRDYDRYPADMSVSMWTNACSYPAGLDGRERSLGLKVTIPNGQVLKSIALRDSDGTSRLTASDYTIWTSTDNQNYTQVTGWTLSQQVVSGRLVHTVSGLSVSAPYVKIHQRYTDEAYSFVLNSLRNDVTVTFGAP